MGCILFALPPGFVRASKIRLHRNFGLLDVCALPKARVVELADTHV